jgi:hypothetical protein
MKKEWKFEPDPLVRGYINYLDKSPVTFDALKQSINLKNKPLTI